MGDKKYHSLVCQDRCGCGKYKDSEDRDRKDRWRHGERVWTYRRYKCLKCKAEPENQCVKCHAKREHQGAHIPVELIRPGQTAEGTEKPRQGRKYRLAVCPHCREQITVCGSDLIGLFISHEVEKIPLKTLAGGSPSEERYLRKLREQIIHLCPKCHKRILPTVKALKIYYSWLGGYSKKLTSEEIKEVYDISSVYKVRKIIRETQKLCRASSPPSAEKFSIKFDSTNKELEDEHYKATLNQ